MIYLKKICFLCISLIIGICVYHKNNEVIIPSESIRFRIIANSNNIKDLYEKKKIKEEIENDLYNMVSNIENLNSARNVINNNLDKIRNMINSKTKDYKINYGINYFPKKIYKGVIYPEGEYESLVITLGSGLGDNWWCVLYPPLCLIEDNKTTEDIEYKLLVSKILNIDIN